MSFNESTGDLIRTHFIPQDLLAHGMNMNDLRLNTTLGYASMTDSSMNGSLVAINLDNSSGVRRLFNTIVMRADEGYVGSYDGELIYSWNGTQRNHSTTAADDIALGESLWLYWCQENVD